MPVTGSEKCALTEAELAMKKGLPAREVDRRLLSLSRQHSRLEAALCFYLREVDERELYREFGFSSTVDYARERLGFEDRKTRSLLYMAGRFEELPRLSEAFRKGDLAWTKVREAVKVARPETESEWLRKCREMSNRQLEQEVRQTLPPAKKRVLVLVLEGDRVDSWEQTREATERLAGKTLSDLEVFDLMCAEMLCTYATTPAFPGGDELEGGYARLVAERDGWKCTRPGCSNRSALQGNHIIPRGRGGPDEPWNIHLVCCTCHAAITAGRLKVSGRAPDGLNWEGPLGVIEKPLPLPTATSPGSGAPAPCKPYVDQARRREKRKAARAKRQSKGHLFSREPQAPYEVFKVASVGGDPSGLNQVFHLDHVIHAATKLKPGIGDVTLSRGKARMQPGHASPPKNACAAG